MRVFSMNRLALLRYAFLGLLLRPARFSSCFAATPEDEASDYLEEVLKELSSLEDLQETLLQIEKLEIDRAKVASDEAAVRTLVGQINQRQLHAVVRALTELESLELARRDAESGATAATGGGTLAVRLPPDEQLEELLGAEAILRESDAEIESWILRVMDDQVQQMVGDLRISNDTGAIVEDAASAAVQDDESCVPLEAAALQVQEAVVQFSLDGIGRVDHAQGGTIVHERTSPTFEPPLPPDKTLGSAAWARFIPEDWERLLPPGWQDWRGTLPVCVSHALKGRLSADAAPPEAILDGSTLPGACWPMQGSTGRVTIRLPYPVNVRAVSIDHASALLLGKDGMSSAPKTVMVHGYPACPSGCDGLGFDANRRVLLLKSLIYDIHQGGVQTFPVPPTAAAAAVVAAPTGECGAAAAASASSVAADSDEEPGSCRPPNVSMGAVEFEVHDNWGNAEYTCLYRFRVHGDAAGLSD